MKITNPKLEVVRFNADDVIATSAYVMTGADYNRYFGGNYDDSAYIMFNGSMVATGDSGPWSIVPNSNPSPRALREDEIEGLRTGKILDIPIQTFFGITYSAYVYNDELYTNGVTYWDLRNGQ